MSDYRERVMNLPIKKALPYLEYKHGHRDARHAAAEIAAEADAEVALLRDIAEHAAVVMRYLSESGANVVPHLIDTDDNPGQRLRAALADYAALAATAPQEPDNG